MAHIHVGNLILEVTRRCNLHCAHCLRGEAQDKFTSNNIIEKAVDTFSSFSNVTFTGGEPSLNCDGIQHFFEYAEFRNKLPESFFVATNGVTNQTKLAHVLLDGYARITKTGYIDDEITALHVSKDQFHDPVDDSVFRGLSFYQPTGHSHTTMLNDTIIPRGRALENGLGNEDQLKYRPKDFDLDVSRTIDGQTDIFVDTVYVTVNGLCHYDCDLDYNTLDTTAPCRLSNARTYFTNRTKNMPG